MKTKAFIFAIFQVFVLSILFATNSYAEDNENSGNIYGRFSALQCDSLIKANETNPNFVILDVRTPSEWNSGHIWGSINRSTGLADFTEQLNALPKQKIFLLHCQSGGRSAGAFEKMKSLGFSEVHEMIGGLNAWNTAKLATTKVIEPKLMLVSYVKLNSSETTDTVKVTVTNRANGLLTFSSAVFNDEHPLMNSFNEITTLEGAADYTFTILHTTPYTENDSTTINIASNGGQLHINVAFKSGNIQGIKTSPLNEFVLYPNPATNQLYIRSSYQEEVSQISVFNLIGKEVITHNNAINQQGIDVSGLPTGVYFLHGKVDKQSFSRKFIIKR